MPKITLLFASLHVLLMVVLLVRISQHRHGHKIGLGDGGDADLFRPAFDLAMAAGFCAAAGAAHACSRPVANCRLFDGPFHGYGVDVACVFVNGTGRSVDRPALSALKRMTTQLVGVPKMRSPASPKPGWI